MQFRGFIWGLVRNGFSISVSDSCRAELQARLRKAQPWQRRRIKAVLAAARGRRSFRGLVRNLNTSAGALRSWTRIFRSGGVQALLWRKKPPGGRPRVSDPGVRKELAEAIQNGRLRTTRQVSWWLWKSKKIRLKPKSVYRLLRELGLRFLSAKDARPAAVQRNEGGKQGHFADPHLPTPPKRGRPKLKIRLNRRWRPYLQKRLGESKQAYSELRAEMKFLDQKERRYEQTKLEKRGLVYDRLQAVFLATVENKSIVEIADKINRGASTIQRWLSQFVVFGAGIRAIDELMKCQIGRPFAHRSKRRPRLRRRHSRKL